MALISVEEARALLPRVGDRLMLVPTLHKKSQFAVAYPSPCVVEYVHREHLWYKVRFDAGFTECFHAIVGGGYADDPS